MPRPIWPDAIQRAFFDAWIENANMPDEEREKRIDTFEHRWGGLDTDAFKQALQEGYEAERLCALFALGYLAPAAVEELLVPFLHSPVRKERWASAITLGEHKDERAFTPLQNLLVEKMGYHPPPADENLMNIVFKAMRQARERFGSLTGWERLVDPTLVKVWHAQEAYDVEYTWHMIHRITITNVLGAWGDSRAIQALRQALQKCWEIEQLPPVQGGVSGGSLETWHHLEDDLAYALGQLAAWHALDGLGLPPTRFKLARLYLVFGSLGVNLQHMYDGNITLLINIGTIDPNRVTNVLREQFGLDEYVARANLKVFQQWYQERDEKPK